MTISTENRVAGPYEGAGVTPNYTFSFKVFAVSDLVVTKTVSSVDSTLAYGSDYSVSLNADQDANPGGTVTYCVAGVPTNLPSGANLTITTAIPYTQGTQLTNGGGWYPKVVEYALDRLVAIVQQLKSIGDRALRLPITVTGVTTTLPVPSAGKLIGWDSLGTSIENKDPSSIASSVIYGTGKADIFSGNGSQTAFTLSANPGAQANMDVAISGVTQRPGIDFTWTTGTTINFTTAPPAGVNNVLVRYVQAVPTTGALQISANLADVQDKPTARSNLGVSATGADPNYAKFTDSGNYSGSNTFSGNNTYTKGQRGAPTALNDAATVAVDLSLANNYTLTIGGNRTLGAPTNAVAGQSGAIVITQDGTGGRTLGYNAAWKFPSGAAPALSTPAGAVDLLTYYVASSSVVYANLLKGFA